MKNSAQLELCSAWLRRSLDLEGGGGNPNLFLHILSSLVNFSMHTETWLCNLPESALKVPVGGGWWVVVVIE